MKSVFLSTAVIAFGLSMSACSYTNMGNGNHSIAEVMVYDDCDVWLQSDVTRLGNFIVTRNQRNEEQHLEGLNFFRDKYGNTSFNICYDALVTGTNG